MTKPKTESFFCTAPVKKGGGKWQCCRRVKAKGLHCYQHSTSFRPMPPPVESTPAAPEPTPGWKPTTVEEKAVLDDRARLIQEVTEALTAPPALTKVWAVWKRYDAAATHGPPPNISFPVLFSDGHAAREFAVKQVADREKVWGITATRTTFPRDEHQDGWVQWSIRAPSGFIIEAVILAVVRLR